MLCIYEVWGLRWFIKITIKIHGDWHFVWFMLIKRITIYWRLHHNEWTTMRENELRNPFTYWLAIFRYNINNRLWASFTNPLSSQIELNQPKHFICSMFIWFRLQLQLQLCHVIWTNPNIIFFDEKFVYTKFHIFLSDSNQTIFPRLHCFNFTMTIEISILNKSLIQKK